MIIQGNNLASNFAPTARAHGRKNISGTNGATGAESLTAQEPEQLPVSDTDLTAAGSPILDEESAKQNAAAAMSAILAQSTTAMLAQANLKPESALRLLQQ